jgi:hypothetical protein
MVLVLADWDSIMLPPLVLSLIADHVEVVVELVVQLSLINAYPAYQMLI